MTMRPLVVDPVVDEQLRRVGYAVVPVLGRDEVAALLERAQRLEHQVTTDRSFAAGFHATIIDDRVDYRIEAHDVIATAVSPRFDELFVDMELVMVNWLHKAPGAAAVPNHVDWTFVDETEHRSLSVWVPLVDTDEEHGAIGVIPHSHEAVDFVRAAAHPSYTETDAFGATLPGRRTVPLRAGEGVVFDHRLVHFSAPHAGPGERLAITCELAPREAELLHFEQIEEGRFRRHVVEPAFFVTYAAGQDPCLVPGHQSVSEVPGRSFTWPAPEQETTVREAPAGARAPQLEQPASERSSVSWFRRWSGRR